MKNQSVVHFLTILGGIENQFRKTSIELSKCDYFSKVDNSSEFRSWDNGASTVSMGINADMKKPLNDDLHCWGMSYTITVKDNFWKFSGEIGWSSYELGFDEQESIEFESNDFVDFIILIRPKVLILLENYTLRAKGMNQS